MTISNFAAFSEITNKVRYFMKYHTLFFSKIRKDFAKFILSAAIMIDALLKNLEAYQANNMNSMFESMIRSSLKCTCQLSYYTIYAADSDCQT